MTTNTEHRPTADIEDLKDSLYDFVCMRLEFQESGNVSDGELLLTRAAELRAKASAVVDKLCWDTRYYAGVHDDVVFIGALLEVIEAADKALKHALEATMFVKISCPLGWKVEKIFVEKQGTNGNMFKGTVHIMTFNTKDLHVCPGYLDEHMGVNTQVYEIPPEILPEHLGLPSTYKMLTGTIYGNLCRDGIIISGTARKC